MKELEKLKRKQIVDNINELQLKELPFLEKQWRNLTTTTITKSTEGLKIKPLAQEMFSKLSWLIGIIFFFIFLGALYNGGSGISFSFIIIFIVLFVISSAINFILNHFNHGNVFIGKNRKIRAAIEVEIGIGIGSNSRRKRTITQYFEKPYFIDLYVKPNARTIRITLEIKGQKIGHFTLKNGKDLELIIDNMVTLLDLELENSYKLLEGEMLSFKSKGIFKKPYSGLNIQRQNSGILIESPKRYKWFQVDFTRQLIRNKRKEFLIKDIEKILIQNYWLGAMRVVIITKDGKTKSIFEHKGSEIMTLRSKKEILKALQNEPVLKDVEIKIV